MAGQQRDMPSARWEVFALENFADCLQYTPPMAFS